MLWNFTTIDMLSVELAILVATAAVTVFFQQQAEFA